jgi:uncharacterized metal-binding protein YceD (DUF177 family)
MKSSGTAAPEFSHALAVDKIPPTGVMQTLEANERQRKALAERFDLIELPKLHAEFNAEPTNAGQTIAVSGTITADVVQRCVVTLEPLPAHIETVINVLFTSAAPDDPDLDPEESEVEPIINGIIDLGELAAQHLGVALDPYPRKPGAAFGEAEYGDNQKRENPFIRLAELAKKPKD